MPLTAGSRLGRYDIVAALGAGGMGEVYRARDRRLGRDVALKVLPAGVAADAERLARFEHEARIVAGLNHPNIVTLYSVEDEDGIRFLTMELVEGQGLDRQVTAGGLPIARVIELGVGLADALAAAHEKGVVHRDLKPANVMLTSDGRVKVLDFGLAKLADSRADSEAAQAVTIETPVSAAGQVAGTVPYMAPEQVRGEPVDSRTDLFALGVLLYELTTGRRPFEGATQGLVSSAILRDTPASLSSVRADAPTDLDRIVARCLEKEPHARIQTARDVSNELRRAGTTRDVVATILKAPPIPSTALLGREETLEAAMDRVRGGARLLTVTGYGGTGKTRFSIELFHRLVPEYPGGAAFVSLAAVTAASSVLPNVCIALDIPEAHGRTALDALCTVIGQRRMLMMLDNLEQVIDVAEELAALVARCPALQLIATSRAPLKISSETEFTLPPLELPAPQMTSVDALRTCPSVALFLQRAVKVKQDFTLTDTNSAAIAAICRQLDGLPLALELAAARVRVIEPATLLERLDHALDLLTSGDRDLPLRQRTLRATISWSYSLLDAAEQLLLRRLSSFHEGWTLEAMEHVCYPDDERYRALDELNSLVEKGLVRLVGSGERYALLETIRAFAAEQLHAGGEVAATRHRHADYYLHFAAGVAARFRDTHQLAAVRSVRTENANTHAAIQCLTASARAGDPVAAEKGLLLCGHLNWFWHIGGQHFTARVLLDVLLPLALDAPPSRGRALARLAAAMVSTATGEWERSLAESVSGYEDGRAIGDAAVAAEGKMFVGYSCLSLGRMDDAAAALDDAMALSANGVCDFLHGISLTLKGMLRFVTGDLEAGQALIEKARVIQERLHDREGGGMALSFLAQMSFARGDLVGATALYDQALDALATIGDQPEVARVHCEMGWTALAAGDVPAAQRSFRLGVQANEGVGSAKGTGLALLGLAAVEAVEGRSERAIAIAAAAHAFSERTGVVIEHPMDPGVLNRIDALKASIPAGRLEGLLSNASVLSSTEVLAMISPVAAASVA